MFWNNILGWDFTNYFKIIGKIEDEEETNGDVTPELKNGDSNVRRQDIIDKIRFLKGFVYKNYHVLEIKSIKDILEVMELKIYREIYLIKE